MRSLGQTVFVRDVPVQGSTLTRKDDTITITIPLATGQTVLSAIATHQPLLDWDNADAVFYTKRLSAGPDDYHLFADGVYSAMPTTYRPHTGTQQAHIYRCASALLLGPARQSTNGPLFTTLGKSIVYLYLDAINDAGFIPTAPQSTWLWQDYQIDQGYYDTRFNAETAKRLMLAAQTWHDPAIEQAAIRMLDFYCAYADAHAFTVGESVFVQDYGNYDDSFLPNTSACSLNHYLTNGLLLLRAGTAYARDDYTQRGYAILRSINTSAWHFIQTNGDLWYALRPDGVSEKNDYIDVTYNDLLDACALLSKLGTWNAYPGIQALLASKEEWLLANGHKALLRPHAAYTAF